MKRAVLSILLVVLPVPPALADLPTRLERDAMEQGYVSVRYPRDFDAGKAYPILYWFHGTSGKPGPGIGSATEEYVTVGMTYLKTPHVPAGEYGKAHWRECQEVRAGLEAEGLRFNHEVVAGVSKGGWVSFHIAREVPDGPDAVGIIAAGKPPGFEKPGPMPKSLSVLIGVGETDSNYPYSQVAVDYFRKAGVKLCYEEWLGKGHVSLPSGRVLAWLELEALRGRRGDVRRFADKVLKEELENARGLEEVPERYVAIRSLLGHPAWPHAGPEVTAEVRREGKLAGDSEELVEWLACFKQLRTLVERETAFLYGEDVDVAKLGGLVERYRKLGDEARDPALAARAAYAVLRVEKIAELQTRKLELLDTPEYKTLYAKYKELYEEYREAKGNPGPDVIQDLNQAGARISELRNKATMDAFYKVEWRPQQVDDPVLAAQIKADPVGAVRPCLGAGF